MRTLLHTGVSAIKLPKLEQDSAVLSDTRTSPVIRGMLISTFLSDCAIPWPEASTWPSHKRASMRCRRTSGSEKP